MKFFMNEIGRFLAGICSEHWSKGKRERIEDTPDIMCTEDYRIKLENSKPRCANGKRRKARKLAAVKRCSQHTPKAKRRLIESDHHKEVNVPCLD